LLADHTGVTSAHGCVVAWQRFNAQSWQHAVTPR